MTDFIRDMEIITSNVDIVNNGTIRFIMRYRSRIDDKAIGELNLKQRSENVLLRGGIKTIGAIFNNKERLAGLRGSGKVTVKNVLTAAMSYYYDQLNAEERKEFWRDTVEATMELVR
jgi:DNA-directed RNA polymerase alpha subunit